MLVKVTSRAWSLDILALLHGGTPGRQAALLSQTGAGRTAFTQSLGHLLNLGLLERNPGYGHPLRPEYRLTANGTEVAIIADNIKKVTPQASDTLLRRAWTIPVLVASREPRYFNEIKSELVTITDRALSISLKQLEEQHWLERSINMEIRSPRPVYQVVNSGARICQAVSL